MAMVLQSEQKYFLYLLRMELFSSPEKIILSIIIDQQILTEYGYSCLLSRTEKFHFRVDIVKLT